MKKNIIQSFIVIVSTLTFVSCSGGGSDGNTFIPTGTLATQASLDVPTGVAISGTTVYIAEALTTHHSIHQVKTNYISTFAGTGSAGGTNGTGAGASFYNAFGLAVDASGNVFVADAGNHVIRKITPVGVVTTFAGQMGVSGSANGTGVAAQFNNPIGLVFSATGDLYVADSYNNKIRKITPAGVVTTFAGTGVQGATNGAGTVAEFNNPANMAFDSAGNLFVTDMNNFSIRKITPGAVVSLFAGLSGGAGSANGTGTAARFDYPMGIVRDTSDNLFVSDMNNHAIRKITPAAVVTTYSGLPGTPGSTNGTIFDARFNSPTFIAIAADNTLYISESGNKLVRVISPGLSVVTFAGH